MKWNWKIALELCGIVLAALLKLCIPQDDDPYWCANRVYPDGTQKKSPNRVTSRILARAICGRDSIGTTLLFGGNDLFAICL